MSFLLLVVAVVGLYYGFGVLRWDRASEFRATSPAQPSWLRWRLSLRPGRVLQCGQVRPGGIESVAAALPLWIGDDLESVAAGSSLPLAPELGRRDGPTHRWSHVSVRRVDVPEEHLEVRWTRGIDDSDENAQESDHLARLVGSSPICDSWAELLCASSPAALIDRSFDAQGLRDAVDRVRSESAALGRWCQVIAVFWFVGVPAFAAAHALLLPRLGIVWPRDQLLLALLGAYLVVLAIHHRAFWRLSAQWSPDRTWGRIGQVLIHTVSPADAMLCLGPLSAGRLVTGHPVAQAAAMGGDREIAARLVRSLCLSRAEDSPLRVRVLAAVQEAGFDWRAAIAPPDRETPGVATWCPSCRAQFLAAVHEQGLCPDCEGVDLRTFPDPAGE